MTRELVEENTCLKLESNNLKKTLNNKLVFEKKQLVYFSKETFVITNITMRILKSFLTVTQLPFPQFLAKYGKKTKVAIYKYIPH